jgi:hypothetical protein
VVQRTTVSGRTKTRALPHSFSTSLGTMRKNYVPDLDGFASPPSCYPARVDGDGRTAWLCYAANFSVNTTPTLKKIPPGSTYCMNLHEFKLGGD